MSPIEQRYCHACSPCWKKFVRVELDVLARYVLDQEGVGLLAAGAVQGLHLLCVLRSASRQSWSADGGSSHVRTSEDIRDAGAGFVGPLRTSVKNGPFSLLEEKARCPIPLDDGRHVFVTVVARHAT